MARVIKAVEGELILGSKITLLSECGFEAIQHRRVSENATFLPADEDEELISAGAAQQD